MTAQAQSGYVAVIEACTRKGCCRMTGTALIVRRQMRCMLAGCADTVMAAAARADRTTVVKTCAGKGHGIVTAAAFRRGRQMRGMLAGCPQTVVAGTAGAGNAGMVKAGAKPGIGGMAHVAFRGSLWMPGMFAGRSNAVMAAAAGTYYGTVVYSADAGETDSVMAVFTGWGRGDMGGWQARRHKIVVTELTGLKYATVVESCAAPCVGGVTVIADIAADNMLCVFTRCAAVVVTQRAFHWRALELTANMAAGAVYKLMLAG